MGVEGAHGGDDGGDTCHFSALTLGTKGSVQ